MKISIMTKFFIFLFLENFFFTKNNIKKRSKLNSKSTSRSKLNLKSKYS